MREVFRIIVALSFFHYKIEKEFYELDLYLKSAKDMHKMLEFRTILKILTENIFSGEYSDISIYSPQLWPVYERVKNDLKKANNVLEDWNRSLNSCIFQPKPYIYE
ncbi:hypothetical protein DMUE_2821 [Dictyocoela muelleri]|nr:hypothetical protein DMUE_2821 [Dictyocoela muelleri]